MQLFYAILCCFFFFNLSFRRKGLSAKFSLTRNMIANQVARSSIQLPAKFNARIAVYSMTNAKSLTTKREKKRNITVRFIHLQIDVQRELNQKDGKL